MCLNTGNSVPTRAATPVGTELAVLNNVDLQDAEQSATVRQPGSAITILVNH